MISDLNRDIPSYLKPPQLPTLKEREARAVLMLDSDHSSLALLNAEAALFISGNDVPAQLEQDIATFAKRIQCVGASLGGIRTALRKQKI